MKKLIQLVAIALLSISSAFAQDLQVSASLGFSGLGNPFDGLFTAADVYIPVGIKGVSVNPSLSFQANSTGMVNEYHYDVKPDAQNQGTTTDYSFDNNLTTELVSGSMLLFVNLNPFKWFKNEKLQQIDMGIGYGYGLRRYVKNSYELGFNSLGEKGVRVIENKGGFAATQGIKAYYNYHFKRCFVGLQAGVLLGNFTIAHDDDISVLALQFGIQL